MCQATVEQVTISSPNPDPRGNGTGWGIHNGGVGKNKKWHAYIFTDKARATNYANSINQDFHRFAPVNLGYPEPFAFYQD